MFSENTNWKVSVTHCGRSHFILTISSDAGIWNEYRILGPDGCAQMIDSLVKVSAEMQETIERESKAEQILREMRT